MKRNSIEPKVEQECGLSAGGGSASSLNDCLDFPLQRQQHEMIGNSVVAACRPSIPRAGSIVLLTRAAGAATDAAGLPLTAAQIQAFQ